MALILMMSYDRTSKLEELVKNKVALSNVRELAGQLELRACTASITKVSYDKFECVDRCI